MLLGLKLLLVIILHADVDNGEYCGAIVQYPNTYGSVSNLLENPMETLLTRCSCWWVHGYLRYRPDGIDKACAPLHHGVLILLSDQRRRFGVPNGLWRTTRWILINIGQVFS